MKIHHFASRFGVVTFGSQFNQIMLTEKKKIFSQHTHRHKGLSHKRMEYETNTKTHMTSAYHFVASIVMCDNNNYDYRLYLFIFVRHPKHQHDSNCQQYVIIIMLKWSTTSNWMTDILHCILYFGFSAHASTLWSFAIHIGIFLLIGK